METEEKVQKRGKKCNRKKFLLFGISAVVLIGLIIWAIQVIPVANRYKREHIDAKAFVSNWNARSKEDDLLTGGLKISDSSGEHEYQLKNGLTLRYSVNSYWWVKYMATSVILEFPEEEPGNVYGLSRMLLETIDEVADVDAVFGRAQDAVDRNSLSAIERFSVGMESETQEAYAVFVAKQTVESDAKDDTSGPAVLKTQSIIGYSWKLTIEEWCGNFNKNLEFALYDAAQNAYSWVSEIETVEPSFKEEWIATNREKYKALTVSDFRKEQVITDGVHENVIYGCYLPNVDGWLNKIIIVVDANGYIVECECVVLQSLQDVVNQYAGGDKRPWYMEYYGCQAVTVAGTGVSYSKAKKAVEELYAFEVETKEVSDTVCLRAIPIQKGLSFTCLPNRVGVYETFSSISQTWTVKEVIETDTSETDDTKQAPAWSLTQEELDEKFRSAIYEQETDCGMMTGTYEELLSNYMEWYDVNFFKPGDERLEDYSSVGLYDYSFWDLSWGLDGFAQEYGVSTEYMYVAIVFGDAYDSALYPEESGRTYYRDAMKVLMLFDENGEVIKTIVLSQAGGLRSNVEEVAYYLYRTEAE